MSEMPITWGYPIRTLLLPLLLINIMIDWMAAAAAFSVLLMAHVSTADFPARASNQSSPLLDSLWGSKKKSP